MAEKKRKLKDIIRERGQGDKEHEDFTKELVEGSDRGVAIITGAITEGALSELILAKLDITDDKLVAPLFEREGPLSSFFSVTVLAKAMKLITEEEQAELTVVRRVRNAFAHTRRAIKFTTAEVKTECKKLSSWREYGEGDDGFSGERAAFIVSALGLHRVFVSKATDIIEARIAELKRAPGRLA